MNIYSILSLVAGSVCFFFAALVLLKGRKSSQNRSFFLATVLTGVWTLFPFLTSLVSADSLALTIARSLYIVAAFVPTGWFYFMVNILGNGRERKKLIIFCLTSFFFSVISYSPFFIKGVNRFAPHFSPQPGPLFSLFTVFFAVVFTCILYRLCMTIRDSRGSRKSQLIYVSWAYLIGAVSGVIHFTAAYANREFLPHDIFIILYPIILTYAILKYRLMDIRVAITRTGVFVVVYTLVLGVPFVLATLGKSWLIELLGDSWWVGPMLLIAALATAGPFLYIFLQRRAEALLLREQKQYQQTLKQTAMEMTKIRNLRVLLDLITNTFINNVCISHCALYLFDAAANEYFLKAGYHSAKDQIGSLTPRSPLIEYLESYKEPSLHEEMKQMMEERNNSGVEKVVEEMYRLNASVVVPSFSEDRLIAIFVLGDKLSGRTYTSEDLSVFSVLASQAALAIDNAQLYESMEEQVRQRTKELVEVQKQLVQAEKLATVGTLAGGVAHEINNPLAAILTNVQMLLTPDVEWSLDEAKESLELIEEATKRCRTIVKKLMVYAKKPLESAEVSKVDLFDVLDKAINFLIYQLSQDNIKITSRIKEKGYFVSGNHNELEQVFTNIILNARDAIKSVKKSGSVDIWLNQEGSWLEVHIKDDGLGMPPQVMSKIFDPFFTTKDVGKGLGLGLSICQSIMEKHKGVITVKSEPDKGAEFTVKLPRLEINRPA